MPFDSVYFLSKLNHSLGGGVALSETQFQIDVAAASLVELLVSKDDTAFEGTPSSKSYSG